MYINCTISTKKSQLKLLLACAIIGAIGIASIVCAFVVGNGIKFMTKEEKEEQAALRREYINEFRLSLGGILDNTVIKRPDGSVEPLKKDEKKNK